MDEKKETVDMAQLKKEMQGAVIIKVWLALYLGHRHARWYAAGSAGRSKLRNW